MDHLLQPEGDAFPPVPYYDKYKYDGGSFTGYPERCGFDKTKFSQGDFRTVPQEDHNSFFQGWLYFGLIHEFLGASLDEFINHQEQRVTTDRLPFWAAEWQQRWSPSPPKWQQSLQVFSCSRRSRSKRLAEIQRAEMQRVNKCLREVRDMITFLDSGSYRQRGWTHLSEEVGLSIIVLGSTFGELCRKTWSLSNKDRLAVENWPPSEFATKRLEAAGWCKSEASRLQKQMLSRGMLYCGYVQNFGRTIDHSRCLDDRCVADDINEETYRTLHAEGCKRCTYDGPKVPDLKSAIAGKTFPVIRLTKSKTSDVHIRVLPYQEGMTYTAISHVWAHGLGNPRENSLPKCQILRLYQVLQSHNRYRRPGWEWRITASVFDWPSSALAWAWLFASAASKKIFSSSEANTVNLWIDTLCVPIDKEFRKKAISSMYDVYSKATTVLVLDRSLLSISAKIPAEELLFRITASPWMTRGWTLQEGALAKALFFQFSDKAIEPGRVLVNLFYRKGGKAHNYALSESYSAFGVLRRCGNSEDVNQLASVLSALRGRSTSHPEDKLICFATMIRCDMDRIIKAEGDCRTQQVYQQLKYIPRTLLWHDGPSLNISGFRWAPKDIFSVNGVKQDGCLALSNRGLLVNAYGMVYFGRSLCMTQRSQQIRDFTTGKWYRVSWDAREPFDGEEPLAILAVILEHTINIYKYYRGVVIRLDCDPKMATPEELSNYTRRCDTISGEYMGRVKFFEMDQECNYTFEKAKIDFEEAKESSLAEEMRKGECKPEEFSKHCRQEVFEMIEEGSSWFMCEGEMRGSEQTWCVT